MIFNTYLVLKMCLIGIDSLTIKIFTCDAGGEN